MEVNIQDFLSEKDVNRLKGFLWTACGQYEPWADMMNLSGAGDPGIDHFPLDMEEIERIEITLVKREEPQESVTS